MTTIGFVGLGRMGAPMAGRLVEAGHDVTVWNRTPGRAKALAAKGARVAGSPAEAAAGTEVVVTMLSDDRALEEVSSGDDGLLSAIAGSVHLSMSTVGVDTTRRLAEAHGEAGGRFVAGPVFGRPEAAAAGRLWTCLAGAAEAKQAVEPVTDCVGQGVLDLGEDPASACVVKLAGNFLLASAIEAMAEAYTMAEKHGVDRQRLAEFFASTLFSCPVYAGYGAAVAARRHSEDEGFKLSLGLKDVELALEAGRRVEAPMPFGGILRDRLLAGVANHRGGLDWSAIALGVAADAGIDVS